MKTSKLRNDTDMHNRNKEPHTKGQKDWDRRAEGAIQAEDRSAHRLQSGSARIWRVAATAWPPESGRRHRRSPWLLRSGRVHSPRRRPSWRWRCGSCEARVWWIGAPRQRQSRGTGGSRREMAGDCGRFSWPSCPLGEPQRQPVQPRARRKGNATKKYSTWIRGLHTMLVSREAKEIQQFDW